MRGASARLYRDLLASAIDTDEVLVAESDGELAGVSVWITVRSLERIRGEAEELAQLVPAYPELARTSVAMQAVAERHPELPHLYLSSMGVLPVARGRGVGSALLRHRLARADAEREATFLEASTTRSQKLYAEHGFTSSAPPIDLPEGGPRVQPMWRDPATTA